jgi:hypothetical protein
LTDLAGSIRQALCIRNAQGLSNFFAVAVAFFAVAVAFFAVAVAFFAVAVAFLFVIPEGDLLLPLLSSLLLPLPFLLAIPGDPLLPRYRCCLFSS